MNNLRRILLLGCGLFSACREQPPAMVSEKPRVALVLPRTDVEPFLSMELATGGYMTTHLQECSYMGAKTGNATEQAAIVDGLAAQHVWLLVIAPADPKSLIPALNRAREAGVVVVNIGLKLDSEAMKQAGAAIPHVGPDMREAARRVGQGLALKLQQGDEVALIEDDAVYLNQERRAGFKAAMSERGVSVVASATGEGTEAKARTVAAQLLADHPAIKAFLCTNDAMAMGAALAVEGAGKKRQVRVVGFDNLPALDPFLNDGRVSATADPHADQWAVYAIEAALKAKREELTVVDKATAVDIIVR